MWIVNFVAARTVRIYPALQPVIESIKEIMPSAIRGILIAMTMLAPSLAFAGNSIGSNVETHTRFLEFDTSTGNLVYEVSIRNLGNLPVSYLDLESDPISLEGTFSVDELGRGDWARRRFSFKLNPGQLVLQPRFTLGFTSYDGERIKSEEERSSLVANADFSFCDVTTGWVDMVFTLTNLGEDPLLFLELRSENPELPKGLIEHESMSPGESVSWTIEFQLEPGDTFFNPTLYLSYHSFGVSGTRLQKKFFTFIQKDLRKVEEALKAEQEEN